MATYNSVEYAVETNPELGSRLQPADGEGMGVRMVRRSWAIPSGAAATETVALCRLNPGEYIVPGSSYLICDNPGTTLTIDIGDNDTADGTIAADPDRWADGIVASAGGGFSFASAPGVATLAPTEVVDDDVVVNAKLATAASLTTGADLVFYIAIASNR